ncbi:hypothetical protein, partial [Pseudomonas inefficax]|uniref:hypothetical protein n=1 Tax=Pseudomonas inefficax TaxID=2078786 RepID=UPI002DBAC15F
MPGADCFYFQLVATANETDWGGFPSGFPRNGGWVADVHHEIFIAWEIERRPRGASQHKAAPTS